MKEKQRSINLKERDIAVLEFCFRYRCALSKTIAISCGYTDLMNCERRLRKLTDVNVLKRKKVIYGLPYIYTITNKGMSELGIDGREYEIKTGTIEHEIGIAKIMSYLYITKNLTFDDLITDRDIILKRDKKNRRIRTHKGDLINIGDRTIVFEYERTRKTIKKLEENYIVNTNRYDEVWYFYDEQNLSIKKHIEGFCEKYHNEPHIIGMNTVRKTIEQFNLQENTLKRNPNANRDIDSIDNRGVTKKSDITGRWQDDY